jgi:hypothetical protein
MSVTPTAVPYGVRAIALDVFRRAKPVFTTIQDFVYASALLCAVLDSLLQGGFILEVLTTVILSVACCVARYLVTRALASSACIDV